MDDLEPTSPEAQRYGTLLRLKEITEFIENCPEIIVPGDLPETLARAVEVMDELEMIEYEDEDWD
jgi:hypothetical protein